MSEQATRSQPDFRAMAENFAKTMHCNCDLDNWQPEPDTGHSHVCRIHRAAKDARRDDAGYIGKQVPIPAKPKAPQPESRKIDDGGPILPGPCQHETNIDIHEGMSLREWYAGQALAGMTATAYLAAAGEMSIPAAAKDLAEICFATADALIAASKS